MLQSGFNVVTGGGGAIPVVKRQGMLVRACKGNISLRLDRMGSGDVIGNR